MKPIELKWSDGHIKQEATENDPIVAAKRGLEPWMAGTVLVSCRPSGRCGQFQKEGQSLAEAISLWLAIEGAKVTLYFEPENQAQRYGHYACTIWRRPHELTKEERDRLAKPDPYYGSYH